MFESSCKGDSLLCDGVELNHILGKRSTFPNMLQHVSKYLLLSIVESQLACFAFNVLGFTC